jgi:hypothetical protein
MTMLKKLMLLGMLATVFQQTKAQNAILSVKVSGVVLARADSNRLSPLSDVNIYHKRRQSGTRSEANGSFAISLLRGDTIIFSRIGYGSVTYTLPNTYNDKKLELNLVMQEKPYILREVKVRATPPPPVGPLQRNARPVYIPASRSTRSAATAGLDPLGGRGSFAPITALYDAFSKRAKEKKLVAVLMARDKKEQDYKARLNPEYVSELTRLEGPELDEFMAFCQPPMDFVLHAEEYDLVVAIVDCQQRFSQRDSYYREK